MATWQLLRGADTLALSDRSPFDVVTVQGVGIPPVRRLTERGPFQDGDTDIGFRLDARTINMVLVSTSDGKAAADTARDSLWEWFKPANTPFVLRCTRDDGTDRQIDVYPMGVIDAAITEQDRQWGFQRYAAQLRAPLPVWYDPTPGSYSAIGGGSTGSYGFTIPMSIAWVMVSGSTIGTTITIPYQGTWSVFPTITLYGPLAGVTVTNETTGEVLDFPSLTLSAGEWIEIDLSYGAKTITDDTGANQIDKLSSDSDLATFHLAAHPDAPAGDNVIHFDVAASATNDTGIKIDYAQHYIAL